MERYPSAEENNSNHSDFEAVLKRPTRMRVTRITRASKYSRFTRGVRTPSFRRVARSTRITGVRRELNQYQRKL